LSVTATGCAILDTASGERPFPTHPHPEKYNVARKPVFRPAHHLRRLFQ
jgi:hypothetical protein